MVLLFKMNYIKKLMEHIGLNPERLRIEFMSSAEGSRFAETVSDFIKKVGTIGPLGKSEGLDENGLKSKLNEIGRLIPYIKIAAKDKLSSHLREPEEWNKLFTKDGIEDYLLYLKNAKGNTTGSCGAVAAGLKFFYTHVIENPIPFDYRLGRKNRKLPTVLSQEEIWKIINATQHLKHRLILMTTYSAGLRAMEVATLKHDHIDSKNMLIKVENGKGGNRLARTVPRVPRSGSPSPSAVCRGKFRIPKRILKRIGSNFRLASKTLVFSYRLPWQHVAATAPVTNWGG
jgi:hypothetical protein